jgi:hypothetical protein
MSVTFDTKYIRFSKQASGVTSPYTKTWSTWDNSVPGENLADGGDTGFCTYARDATDGAAKFTMLGPTSNNEFATPAATNETWETWGIPAGKTVTSVQLVSWKKKLVANTGLSSLTYQLTIVSGTNHNNRATDSTMMPAVTDPLTQDSSYVAQSAGAEVAVSAGYQASNTPIKLKIIVGFTNSGNGADVRFDDVAVQIKFS